jgi:hypothetical protein
MNEKLQKIGARMKTIPKQPPHLVPGAVGVSPKAATTRSTLRGS